MEILRTVEVRDESLHYELFRKIDRKSKSRMGWSVVLRSGS
jgi:hypothetical protein